MYRGGARQGGEDRKGARCGIRCEDATGRKRRENTPLRSDAKIRRGRKTTRTSTKCRAAVDAMIRRDETERDEKNRRYDPIKNDGMTQRDSSTRHDDAMNDKTRRRVGATKNGATKRQDTTRLRDQTARWNAATNNTARWTAATRARGQTTHASVASFRRLRRRAAIPFAASTSRDTVGCVGEPRRGAARRRKYHDDASIMTTDVS